jgi:hypothetical protein
LPVPHPARGLAFRFGAGACLCLLFLWFGWFQQTDPQFYDRMLWAFDGAVEHRPFGDLRAILQAAACWRQGVDVYVPDACMDGGLYNYSPLFLRLGDLKLGLAASGAGGVLTALAFILAITALPAPRDGAEFWLRAAAAASGATLFAVERANIDVLIFVAALFGAWLCTRHAVARIAGYAVFLFLAAIKFYPLTLMVLLAQERFWRAAALGLASLLLVWLFLHAFGHDTAHAMRIIPREYPFGGSFGSINLPYGLSVFFDPPVPPTVDAVVNYQLNATVKRLFMIAQLAALIPAGFAARYYVRPLAALPAWPLVLAVTGAVLIAGCFFAAQNIDYRGIFLLFLMPGFCEMARLAPPRSRFRVVTILIPALLWEAFFRFCVTRISELLAPARAAVPELLFWICREVLWWWLAVQLLALLLAFLWLAARSWLRDFRILPGKIDAARGNL